jgi:arylsulfatase A-like enzyme
MAESVDTMIIFMSDNGAEGAWVEGHPVLGPKMHEVIARLYDNSLDNIGNYNSFVWYGQEYKMFTTEGKLHDGEETDSQAVFEYLSFSDIPNIPTN